MSLSLALLVLGAVAQEPLARQSSLQPDLSSADRQLLNRFLAAVWLKDEATIKALATPEVPVDPDRLNDPGLRQTTLDKVLETTRSCDVGAAIHTYSLEPGYTLNWWCEYADGAGEQFPLSGNAATVRLVGGKVQLRNFTYQRWGPAPRLTK